jgi:hypothetical protein
MTFSFYNPSGDYFVVVDIMVEFLIAGIVVPTFLRVIPFRANIFEAGEEKALQFCDIMRLFLCFYLVYSIYRKIVSTIPINLNPTTSSVTNGT